MEPMHAAYLPIQVIYPMGKTCYSDENFPFEFKRLFVL